MGSGDWFGLPNYGEYVYVFYNKAMFDEAGVSVPTTLEEFEDVLQTFVDQGIVPLAGAGAEYPAGQLWYQLVLAHADRSFVDAYQLFDGRSTGPGTRSWPAPSASPTGSRRATSPVTPPA